MELGAIPMGTLVFVLIAFVGCACFNFLFVNSNTVNMADKNQVKHSRMLVFSMTAMGVICMWLQWVCSYMHQMHPITPPIPEVIKH